MPAYTVLTSWQVDGTLLPQFKEAGYPRPEWIIGKVRNISASLAAQAKQSGALITVPEEGNTEDKYIEPRQPEAPNVAETVNKYTEQFAHEPFVRLVCVNGWEDGMLTEQFEALDRPPRLGVGEIVELPQSLVEKCRASGAALSNNLDDFNTYEGHYQQRYIIPLKAWRDERKEQKSRELERIQKTERKESARQSAVAKLAKVAKLTDEEINALGLL